MVNKVILIGHLGRDPEVRYMPTGSAVTNVTLATSEQWRDKQTGDKQERTEWHQLVFFNRLAEIAGEYLKKGSQVYIEGKLQTRKWEDKNGQDRYTTEVLVREMQMLGGAASGRKDRQQQSSSQPPQRSKAQGFQSEPEPASGGDFDDDIPFMRLHSLMGG